MTTVKTYFVLAEAHLDQAILESAGIRCFLANEATIQTYWLYANAVGGLQLQVAEEDLEDALILLAQKETPQ